MNNLDVGMEIGLLTFAEAKQEHELARADGVGFENSRTSFDIERLFNPVKTKTS